MLSVSTWCCQVQPNSHHQLQGISGRYAGYQGQPRPPAQEPRQLRYRALRRPSYQHRLGKHQTRVKQAQESGYSHCTASAFSVHAWPTSQHHYRPYSPSQHSTRSRLLDSATAKGELLCWKVRSFWSQRYRVALLLLWFMNDYGSLTMVISGNRIHRETKEYNHVVTTVAEALRIESATNTGTIHATLSIPDDAHPSMTTTKIVSIEYSLYLLFDMRPRRGFMERRSRRTVNKKLRMKVLESPGGFDMVIPITVGTISDLEHRHRPNPLALSSSSREAMGAVASLTASASQLSISHGSPSSFHSAPLETSSRSTPSSPGTWRGQPGSSPFLPSTQYIPTTQYMPTTSTRPGGSSGQLTAPAPYGRKLSEPGYHTISTASPESYETRTRSRTLFPQSTTASSHLSKPLPSIPFTPTAAGHMHSPVSISTGYTGSYMPESASGSSSRYFSPITTTSPTMSSPPAGSTPNGYPREKAAPPARPHVQIQPPVSIRVPSPTAPQAVDLGMGLASPDISHHRLSYNQAGGSSFSYFQYEPSTGVEPRQRSSHPPRSQSESSHQVADVPTYRERWSTSSGVPQYRSSFVNTESAPPYTPTA